MANLLRSIAASAPDPALNGRWMVSISSVVGITAHPSRGYIAETISPTFKKTPSQPRFQGGSNNYYPVVADVDALNITFYETHDFRVCKFITAWQQLVYHDGEYGLPIDYKKILTCEYYGLQNSSSAAMTSEYSGVWPTDLNPYDLVYDAPDQRLMLRMTFSCDNVEHK